jgi:hypothetical protein
MILSHRRIVTQIPGYTRLTASLSRPVIVLTTLSAIQAEARAGGTEPAAPPNIVYFLADDLGWDDVAGRRAP